MSHILIAYASTDGQTEKIAHRLAERIEQAGDEATLFNTRKSGADPFSTSPDGVLLGGSVHKGTYQKELLDFVRMHKEALEACPSLLFSVSLTSATKDPEHEKESAAYMDAFCRDTDWQPMEKVAVAGALRYRDYDFLKRGLMRFIARMGHLDTDTSKNHEYTDWEAVDALARRARDMARSHFGEGRRSGAEGEPPASPPPGS